MFPQKIKINFNIFIILIISLTSIKNVIAIDCYSCNSLETENCVQEQDIYSAFKSCRSADCYVMIEQGVTSRGCLDEITHCENNCERCRNNNKCNNKIYPENRLQCHRCNGENCNDENLPISPCKQYDVNADTCFIRVDTNGDIHRGCLDDYQSIDCSENDEICETCIGTGCNSRIINQLNCISCESKTQSNCIDNVSTAMNTECPPNLNSICFTYNNGSDVIRGCSNSNAVEFCTNQPEYCSTCNNESYCNGYTNFKQCFQCTSDDENSKFCSTITDDVSTIICTNSDDECFVHFENNKTTRGCLRENPIITDDCKDTNLCKKCEDSYCNDDPTDIFCIQCNTKDESECANNVNVSEFSVQCDRTVTGQCYRWEEDDEIHRGCFNTLTANKQSECLGQPDKCKICNTDNCNVKTEFQECLNCQPNNDNTSCSISPSSVLYPKTICTNYIDECYVKLENGEITRGCVKDNPSIIEDCINGNGICNICSNNNCNDKLSCIVCDNCEMLKFASLCNGDIDLESCYRLEDNFGNVRRGCLSTLDDEQRVECEAQTGNCKTCDTDNCNAKLNFQQCLNCTSDNNGFCSLSITSESYPSTVCADYSDKCFTNIQNGIVTRGCLNEYPQIDDCSNIDSCNICTDNNCNDELSCIVCENCETDDILDFATLCSGNSDREKCYRLEYENGNVHRGCLSSLDEEQRIECEAQTDHCKLCDTDNCNAKFNFQQCINCTSDSNGLCSLSINSESNPSIICTDYTDKCFTNIKNGIITRGCVNDHPQLIEDCSITDSCNICIDNNCNDKLSCITCENCLATNILDFATICDSDTDDKCYRLEDENGNIHRGCLSSLEEQQQTICETQTDNCKTCNSDICNAKIDFQSCYTCNSSINCVTNTTNTDITSNICTDYMDSCTILIHTTNEIYRGCTTDLKNLPSMDTNLRTTCPENNCNDYLFPTNRPRCHQCSDCVTVEFGTLRPCRLYSEEETCYTYVDENKVTYRGCMSDETEFNCTTMPDKCKICTVNNELQVNECNNQIAISDPKLHCIKCSDNKNCAWGHQTNVSTKCTNQVLFTTQESCYTKTNADGTVQRGCSLDEPICTANDICDKCANDACNNGNVITQSCIQCNSNKKGEQACGGNLTLIKIDINITISDFAETCKPTIIEYDQRGCYKWTKDDVTERGCAVDLTPEDLENCKSEKFKSCEYCDGNENCNFGPPPNNGNIINGSIINILLSIIILIGILK